MWTQIRYLIFLSWLFLTGKMQITFLTLSCQVCLKECVNLSKSVRHCGHRASQFSSVQFSRAVVSDSLRPHDPSKPGHPVHQQLLEFTQTHVHRVSDAIQPSHPLSFPSPPVLNPSQHQSLFQWVNSHEGVTRWELGNYPLNGRPLPRVCFIVVH